MLSKCANPACGTPFRYLHEGRIFNFDSGLSVQAVHTGLGHPADREIEHYWLCARCAQTLTVVLIAHQPVLHMRHAELPAAAEASRPATAAA